METKLFFLILIPFILHGYCKEDEGSSEEEEESPQQMEYYKYLVKRLKQSALAERTAKQRVVPMIYEIPGPFEPLPGRTHNGDYWPVFPFSNQYSGGVDLDPSISRHIGGDLNIPVPSWGMMDITGHFFNRISDTTTKFGYINHPVNMLGLSKQDFATLVSDPRVQANRYVHPTLPLGKVPRTNVPVSCKPPMCNPYVGTFTLGIDHDIGGHDGNDGDINIPFPISKGVAYRFPFGGNYYYDLDNITVTYGHNLSPLDPFSNPYMFNNDYSRRRELLASEPNVFPRTKRDAFGYNPYASFYTSNDYSRNDILTPGFNTSPKTKKTIIGYIPVIAEEVPQEISKSTKVTPEDFRSYSKSPLRRLRKLMKRGTEKLTVEKTIIPIEAFNPPYFPTPINQGYLNPDENYYPPPQFRQQIQTNFDQDDRFYGPPLIPKFNWMN
ncbi:hypothetical protein FO519_006292 [Halicephalobus sp. NKZ332]|nr:hypothetical protein FO519_006292 [Halicephalobus sp. NKZ332]